MHRRVAATIVIGVLVAVFVGIGMKIWIDTEPMRRFDRNSYLIEILVHFYRDTGRFPRSREDLFTWASAKNVEFNQSLVLRNGIRWGVDSAAFIKGEEQIIVHIEGNIEIASEMNRMIAMQLEKH